MWVWNSSTQKVVWCHERQTFWKPWKFWEIFESFWKFLKVLDTFERLHDLEIRKSRLERISQYEPPPGSPNLELDTKEIADLPGPQSGQLVAKMNEKCFSFCTKTVKICDLLKFWGNVCPKLKKDGWVAAHWGRTSPKRDQFGCPVKIFEVADFHGLWAKHFKPKIASHNRGKVLCTVP